MTKISPSYTSCTYLYINWSFTQLHESFSSKNFTLTRFSGLILCIDTLEHFAYWLLKWQPTIFVQSVEKILSEVPTVPSVYDITIFSCYSGKVELIISMTTAKEKQWGKTFWIIDWTMDQYLSFSSRHRSQVYELRVVAFYHKLTFSVWNNMLG